MIDWNNLEYRTRIYLLAMIGIDYQNYEDMDATNCEDAKKLDREYKIGLRSLTLDDRVYFNPFEVMRPNPSDNEGIRCGSEAESIFYENF